MWFRFDPNIHLNLQMPEFVKVFPDFTNMKKTPCFKSDANGSRFAYSAPFQVLKNFKILHNYLGVFIYRMKMADEKLGNIYPGLLPGNVFQLNIPNY